MGWFVLDRQICCLMNCPSFDRISGFQVISTCYQRPSNRGFQWFSHTTTISSLLPYKNPYGPSFGPSPSSGSRPKRWSWWFGPGFFGKTRFWMVSPCWLNTTPNARLRSTPTLDDSKIIEFWRDTAGCQVYFPEPPGHTRTNSESLFKLQQ